MEITSTTHQEPFIKRLRLRSLWTGNRCYRITATFAQDDSHDDKQNSDLCKQVNAGTSPVMEEPTRHQRCCKNHQACTSRTNVGSSGVINSTSLREDLQSVHQTQRSGPSFLTAWGLSDEQCFGIISPASKLRGRNKSSRKTPLPSSGAKQYNEGSMEQNQAIQYCMMLCRSCRSY